MNEPVTITDASGRTAKVDYNYFMNLLGAIDKTGAAILGLPADTTISADLAIEHHNIVQRIAAHVLTEVLDFIQPHHVELAAESDQGHAENAITVSKQEEATAAKEGI